MLVVVADSGPIHYLVLIGHIEILRELFGKVIIPSMCATNWRIRRHPKRFASG